MTEMSQKAQKVRHASAVLAMAVFLTAANMAPAFATSGSDIFAGLVKTCANMAKEPYEILSVPFRLHSGGSNVMAPTVTNKTTTTTTTTGK